jgi:UDP-N-acetylglucosamine--N-acetylmuramyl-(pentapeptide) pyrophosphoryl-undecaprenol N-acetylglucosamine transferase
MTKKKILIATGGTGGHVFPALSLANYLKKKNLSVRLIVDKRGIKFLKGYENLDFIEIPSSPLIKKSILKFLISLIIIFFSIFNSFLFLLINRPSIIFGMGGYSSFPICIAATILRIKFVIYENNLIIGKANKYLLPFSNKMFVSYKELEGAPVKYANKVNEIGNLLREEIINFHSIDQVKKFDTMKILVLGGSQGAKVFAEQLPQIFEKLKSDGVPITVYQQCQKEQNDQLIEFYKNTNIESEIFHFSDKITKYYSKANLVITRSGASVLGELVNFKIPFISIPLPSSADNHQYKNAEFYLKKGYGYLIEEKNIKNNLYDLLKLIFKDKILISNVVSKQRQHSDKNVLNSLYTQLEKILDEKN